MAIWQRSHGSSQAPSAHAVNSPCPIAPSRLLSILLLLIDLISTPPSLPRVTVQARTAMPALSSIQRDIFKSGESQHSQHHAGLSIIAKAVWQ